MKTIIKFTMSMRNDEALIGLLLKHIIKDQNRSYGGYKEKVEQTK